MRKTVFVPVVLMASLLLGGCLQSEPANPTTGVVDTARIFRDSDAGKAGVKFLESLHEKMQSELNGIQENLQKNPNDADVQQKLQETYMLFQQRMGAEQQNVITLLNDATQRVMDAYRGQKKLDVILSSEAALSFSKAVDITADIIAELNKQKVEFKPVQPEETPTPEAKPDAAAVKDEQKEEKKDTKP